MAARSPSPRDNQLGTGGLTLGGGTLQTTSTFIGTHATTLNTGGGTFNTVSGTLTWNAVIGGTDGGLTKAGNGTMVLNAANTYTGGTTVNAGTLRLGTNGSLATTGALAVNGGTFDLNDKTQTVGALTGTGGTIALGSGALTAGDGSTTTVASAITGTGSFTKQGAGTMTFTGTNSYGATTIADGTLQVGDGGNTGSLGTGAVTNDGSLVLNRGNEFIVGNDISGGGSLTKLGAGTTVLNGAGSYTGGTTVSAGTLQLGSTGSLAQTGALAVDGGTFDLNGKTQTVGALAGSIGTTIALGSGTLTAGDGSNTSVASTITGGSGTGSLVKQGAGTMTLSGTNTYGGGTTINGGVLAISADANLGTGGGLAFANGAALQTTGSFATSRATTLGTGGGTFDVLSGTLSHGGEIGGGGGLTKSGAGTMILTATNSYGGGTTISAGTLQIGNNGTTGSITGNVLNNGTLVFNRSDTLASVVFDGAISGNGAVKQVGTGFLTLTGNNTYRGGTTIDTGTLTVANDGNLGDATGALTFFNAGILDTTTSFDSNRAVTLGDQFGGILNVRSGTTLGLGGAIGGSGPLLKIGSGTLNITGVNNYAGGTFIGGGVVTIDNGSALGTGRLTMLGGSGSLVARADLALTNALEVEDFASGRIAAAAGKTLTLAPTSYTGGADSALVFGSVADNGVVVLSLASGASAGGTSLLRVAGGTLKAGNANISVLTSAGTTMIDGGATLDLAGFSAIVADLQGSGILATGATVGQVTTVAQGSFAGAITGSGGLAKTGPGTLILSGANSYSGGTTVEGGLLQLGAGGSLAAGGALTVNGGTFDLGGNSQAVGALSGLGGTIALGSGVLTTTSSSNATLASAITGAGSLVKQGTGTLILTGSNTYSGGTTVGAGLLQGTTDSLQGSITNNAAVAFSQSGAGIYAGNMSGSGGLAVSGGGTVILTGNNSYTGGTTVTGATLQIGNGGTSGSLAGNIVNNGAVVFNANVVGSYGGVMSGTGSFTMLGGNLTVTGANTYSGGTTVSGGVLQGTITSLPGNITNNSAVVFTGSGTYAGVMSGTGILGVNATGTLTLAGANTYSGGTLVSGGILQGTTTSLQGNITNNAAVSFNQAGAGTYAGIMSGSGGLTVQGGGTVILTGNNSYSGGTTVSGGSTLQGNSTSLQGNILNNASVVFNQTGTGTYAGVMSGSGGMTLQGGGFLNLTGANTYSGPTTVNASTLSVNGSIASAVTLVNGGILSGNGLIGAIVSNGGVVAPGNSIGTLNINGNFTQNGGTYVVEANAAGQSDRVNVAGTATINGANVQVLAQPGTYARNTTYTILSANGGISGTYTGVSSNFAFLTPSLSYSANDVFLTLLMNQSAFTSGAQTGNQGAVGAVLDQASNGATGDFNTVLNALAFLSSQQGPAALNTISGQPIANFGTVNVAGTMLFMNTISQQLAGFRGGTSTGQRQALAQACDIESCDGTSPWGVWASAIGGLGAVQGNANASTLTYNFGGAAAGIDYRLDPRIVVGLGAGYTSSNQWTNSFTGRALVRQRQRHRLRLVRPGRLLCQCAGRLRLLGQPDPAPDHDPRPAAAHRQRQHRRQPVPRTGRDRLQHRRLLACQCHRHPVRPLPGRQHQPEPVQRMGQRPVAQPQRRPADHHLAAHHLRRRARRLDRHGQPAHTRPRLPPGLAARICQHHAAGNGLVRRRPDQRLHRLWRHAAARLRGDRLRRPHQRRQFDTALPALRRRDRHRFGQSRPQRRCASLLVAPSGLTSATRAGTRTRSSACRGRPPACR